MSESVANSLDTQPAGRFVHQAQANLGQIYQTPTVIATEIAVVDNWAFRYSLPGALVGLRPGWLGNPRRWCWWQRSTRIGAGIIMVWVHD